MQQKIYITYSDNGVLADAYEVVLGSDDASPSDRYGVKAYGTNVVVEPDGTAVDHPSVGLYEKVITVATNTVYVVSWKVKPTVNSDYVFETEQIGPFYDISTITATPDKLGTFTQNDGGTLALRLMSLDGTPLDAESITITVKSGDTTIFAETPEKIKTGFYVYEWLLTHDVAPGTYDVYWTYTVNGETRLTLQEVIVAAAGTGTASLNLRFLSLRIALENLIPQIQSVPIYREPAKPSIDNKCYHFTFPRWNQPATANVYRNNAMMSDGFEVDYYKGTITFDRANLSEDVISADYNFRFFDDSQLRLFLTNGINAFNIYPPQTVYGLDGLPDLSVPPTLYEAAVNAIRTFQMQLLWPQNRILFETREQADKAFDQLEMLKKEYGEKAKELSEQKKLFPYKGLTAVILQPMFTLPGGRARFFRYLFGAGF